MNAENTEPPQGLRVKVEKIKAPSKGSQETPIPPFSLEPVPVVGLGDHDPFVDEDTVLEFGREASPSLVSELVEDFVREVHRKKSGK